MTNFISKFKGWKLFLLIYAALLLSSHIKRALVPDIYQLKSEQSQTFVFTVDDGEITDNPEDLIYYDIYNGTEENPPVILVLHGNPEAPTPVRRFMREFSDNYRIISPNFPGYKTDLLMLPDYSYKAQSMYAKQLLDKLGIEQVHVMAHGLGGGTGLTLTNLYPDVVESVIMISAIGVQELELLGGHFLNNGVYRLQYAAVWALFQLTPHFGLLDKSKLSIEYTRSFIDSDQRMLREILIDFEKPMIIVHGISDEIVLFGAALEHHRIVPQSKMLALHGGQDIITSSRHIILPSILKFVEDAELENLNNEPESIRLAKSLVPFPGNQASKLAGPGLALIFILIVIATLISEDIATIGAGLLVARGIIDFTSGVMASLLGIFVGDLGIYFFGRVLGLAAIKYPPFKWMIKEKDLERTQEWFKLRGPVIILMSRFLPGSRFPTYFTAGVIKAPFWRFMMYFGISATLWTPMLVKLSEAAGQKMLDYFIIYQQNALFLIVVFIVFIMTLLKVIVPSFTYKGRRLLYAKYQRIIRWEFWPPYILYIPVVFYVAYLWVKYRSLTIFAAANPGIDAGGFIGESKADILGKIAMRDAVANFTVLPISDSYNVRCKKAIEFIKENEIAFPVILKPDKGQRGTGIERISGEDELYKRIECHKVDMLLQEFVSGEEFGVFYYRMPNEEKGCIFSVTEKKMLVLEGDGECNLEKLILKHPRAVLMAPHHFNVHSKHLYKIPQAGEKFELVSIGTHSKGSVFMDGNYLITEELTHVIDQISKSFDGFYFGRYDIRVPSSEHLKQGKNIKVLELNGVTSESTNIYHPGYSVFHAWKTLMKQWKISYKIGVINAQNGADFPGVSSMVERLARN